MCEDCGSELCTSCLESRTSEYKVCKECHHSVDTPSLQHEDEICPECESEEFALGKRSVEICPQCHSRRIVLIEEKRRTLAQDVRQAIMSVQYGHTKLREFTHKLDSARRSLVSLRMANFLHYYWLEEKIEGVQEELPAIKNRLGNQAEIIANQIAAETKGLIDYNRWMPRQFSFIEGVKNRITELGNHYKQNVDDALRKVFSNLKEVTEQLDGLAYYRREFSEFYEHSELSVNELPVCALPDVKVLGSDFLKNDKADGTLFITNKRIVFIAETGRLRKKTDIIFDFPLIYLKGIEEDGRLRKKLMIRMKQGDLRISCSDETKRVLPDYIEIARKFERYMQTDLQRVRKLEQVNINTSDVRLKIENLVYSLLTSDSSGEVRSPTAGPNYDHFGQAPWDVSRQHIGIGGSYQSPEEFRSHLERTIGRTKYHHEPPARYDSPELAYLRRNSEELNNAIRETIHLMKNGHLVTEDFIRRFRGLIRDSYHTKCEMDRLSNRSSSYRW
ncbi:MAG: hypothetical protein ACFE7R_07670 [Candidatus Hodarchaeota archaeon]